MWYQQKSQIQNQGFERNTPRGGYLTWFSRHLMYGQLDRCPICRSVRSERPARGNTGPAVDRLQGVHFLRCIAREGLIMRTVRHRIRYEVRCRSDAGFYYPSYHVPEYTLTNLRKSTRKRGHDRGRPCQRPTPVEPPWDGGSVCVPSFSGRLNCGDIEATRQVQRLRGATSADLASKRPATLWSARAAVCGSSGAGRAPATNGSRTTRGAVAERSRPVSCHYAHLAPLTESLTATSAALTEESENAG